METLGYCIAGVILVFSGLIWLSFVLDFFAPRQEKDRAPAPGLGNDLSETFSRTQPPVNKGESIRRAAIEELAKEAFEFHGDLNREMTRAREYPREKVAMAIFKYKRVLREDPERAGMLHNLGQLLTLAKRDAEAIQTLKRSWELLRKQLETTRLPEKQRDSALVLSDGVAMLVGQIDARRRLLEPTVFEEIFDIRPLCDADLRTLREEGFLKSSAVHRPLVLPWINGFYSECIRLEGETAEGINENQAQEERSLAESAPPAQFPQAKRKTGRTGRDATKGEHGAKSRKRRRL